MKKTPNNVVVLNGRLTAKSTRHTLAWDLSRLSELRLYGDEFAFNTTTGMLHRISRSAGLILRTLKENQALDEAVERLQAFYGISRSNAERDIEFFFNDLATFGLINPRPSDSVARRENVQS